MTIIKQFEFVTIKEARKIASIDAPAYTSHGDEFIKLNTNQYYLVCNTWLAMCEDLIPDSKYFIHYVYNFLMVHGLKETIAAASSSADRLIHRTDISVRSTPIIDYLTGQLAQLQDLRTALQLLRFPKRFTPFMCEKLTHDSYKNFFRVNARDRELATNPRTRLISRIREELDSMFDGFVTYYRMHSDDIIFSSGSSMEGRLLRQKLSAYSKYAPNLGSVMYPLGNTYRSWEEGYGRYYVITPKAVPKNYKAMRIIAPEATYAAVCKQRIRVALMETLRHNGYLEIFDPEDQEPSRFNCFEGSLNWGAYSTIDLSSASDSINVGLAVDILPDDVWDAMEIFRPKFLRRPEGNVVRNYMLCTSGDPICFILETCIFYAISKVATDFVGTFTGTDLVTPRVFGDDIEVDVRAFDTTCDLLTLFGFTVNAEKSFGPDTRYRESCGVEYLDGEPLHGIYWPRQAIDYAADSFASLVALQHRVFGVSPIAATFLADVIVRRFKGVAVGPDIECDSIWEPHGLHRHLRVAPQGDIAKRLKVSEAPEYMLRTVSNRVCQVFDERLLSNIPVRQKELVEIYHYYSFLKSGPLYLSDEDREWGISVSRHQFGDLLIPITKVTTYIL